MPRDSRWLLAAPFSLMGWACVWVLCGPFVQATAGTVTLAEQIDALVAKGNVVPVAEGIDDLSFLRRAYLDLAGRIPTGEEAGAYLADAGPGRRGRLVDALLKSRECALHLAGTFDVWLMERRRDQHVKAADWQAFLAGAFAENKPYDALVREILSADGADAANRAAARFYLDRVGEPHAITRDVGRIFFGVDLQCAQCHDHPNVDDYLQRDYHSLLAFFDRTSLFHPDTSKPSALTEKADGVTAFESVFTKVRGSALPRPPGGEPAPDPDLAGGTPYLVAPDDKDKNVRPVPTYSRRQKIAEVVSGGGSNQAFNRNIVNRLWAHMMGHGLVEPFDFHHSANPPAHPQLLDLLAREFAAGGYDIRAFLRQLAMTDTYQRRFELPQTLAERATVAQRELPLLKARMGEGDAALREARSLRGDRLVAWRSGALSLDKVAEPVAPAEKIRDEALAAEKKASDARVQASAKLSAQGEVLDAVQTAAKEAARASGLLPDDKALAEASATINGRMEAVVKEWTACEAAVKEAEEALAGAGERLATAERELKALREAVASEKARVAALEADFDAADATFRQLQAAQKHSGRLLGDATALVDYVALLAAVERERDVAREAAEETGRMLRQFAATEQRLLHLSLAARRSDAAIADRAADPELAAAAEVLRSRADACAREFRRQTPLVTQQLTRQDQAEAILRREEERCAGARESLTKRWTSAFALGVFAPLTPEQLCMSTAAATGKRNRLLAAGRAEFDGKLAEQAAAAAAGTAPAAPVDGNAGQAEPEEEAKPAPPPLRPEERDSYVEAYLNRQMEGPLQQYVRLFGGQEGQPQTDFHATADQALFMANNGLVRGWLAPADGNLTDRLRQTEDPRALARELYLGVLTRMPDATEVQRVLEYLAAREGDRAGAVQELAWALLSSVEFRFRH